MKTVLVTGGAGFIGSHVCENLLKRGDKVVCADNLNDFYSPDSKLRNISKLRDNENFKFYKVDITNFDEIKSIFENENPDSIIHLAAMVGVRKSIENPALYENVNIGGTKNIFALAEQFKVKKVVFSSSSSVYGDLEKTPFSEGDTSDFQVSLYACTKMEGEIICRNFFDKTGIPVTCLRFFTVYGPRNRPDMAVYKFVSKIINGEEIERYGDGSTKRDYTYILDIVGGVISSLDNDAGYSVINLGSENPILLKDMIKIIEEKVGKTAKINEMPPQEGDVKITYADISKAREILGYEPKFNFEEGIENFVLWFKENEMQEVAKK